MCALNKLETQEKPYSVEPYVLFCPFASRIIMFRDALLLNTVVIGVTFCIWFDRKLPLGNINTILSHFDIFKKVLGRIKKFQASGKS